jgi:hypothetical protein
MTYSDALCKNASGDVGVTWPSVTFGSHGTTVLHFVILLRQKRGHAQNILPVRSLLDRPPSGHMTDVTSGQKAPTRTDIAQLTVAHAQNILPITTGDVTSGQGQWRHLRLRMRTRSLPVALPHITTSNANWAVPINYSYVSIIVCTIYTNITIQNV